MNFPLPRVVNTQNYSCRIHTTPCNCKELWIIDKRLVETVADSNNIPTSHTTSEELQNSDYRSLIKGFPRRKFVSFTHSISQLPSSLASRLQSITVLGRPVTEPTIHQLLPKTAPIPNSALELDIEMSGLGDNADMSNETPNIFAEEVDLNDKLGSLDIDLDESIQKLDDAMKETEHLGQEFIDDDIIIDDDEISRDIPIVPPFYQPSDTAPDVIRARTPAMSQDLPGQHFNREIMIYIDEINLMLDECNPQLIEDEKCLDEFFKLLRAADDSIEDIAKEIEAIGQPSEAANADQILKNLNIPILCRLNDTTDTNYAIVKSIIRLHKYFTTLSERRTIRKTLEAVEGAVAPILTPLSQLSEMCKTLSTAHTALDNKISVLTENMLTIQNAMSALCVQVTTLSQTVSNMNFTNIQPQLVTDIPTGMKKSKTVQPSLQPPVELACDFIELLMKEACAMARVEITGFESYVKALIIKYPSLNNYLAQARAKCNCAVPDAYLVAIYLALATNTKKFYPQTLAHAKLLCPTEWTDVNKIRDFFIEQAARELACKAGRSNETPVDQRFRGCPPAEPARPRKTVAFLKNINF